MAPGLENNGYWNNRKDTKVCNPDPKSLCSNPFFVDPAGGDYCFDPSSPMLGAGVPVIDIWGARCLTWDRMREEAFPLKNAVL